MVGQTAYRTHAIDYRFQLLTDAGCIPCAIDGWPAKGEIHHVLNQSGQRYPNEHAFTYSVCPWHHRGVLPADIDIDYGPSKARAPREYQLRYGTELELKYIADAVVRILERAYSRNEWISENKMVSLIRALHREIVNGQSPDPKTILKIQ